MKFLHKTSVCANQETANAIGSFHSLLDLHQMQNSNDVIKLAKVFIVIPLLIADLTLNAFLGKGSVVPYPFWGCVVLSLPEAKM